ncbi:hypothetical protein F4604DRAFT_251933 [Suillus subluteus]|nr:hypothetical protein F4604DRAFT_251933 [Suillus subluteus]
MTLMARMILYAGWNLAFSLRSVLMSSFWLRCFFLCHTISADVVLPVNCVCSFRSLKNRWFVIVTLSFFFHYGLRCALVGRALTCALPRLFVLPLFFIFSLVFLPLVRMAMFCLAKSFIFFTLTFCCGSSQLYVTCATFELALRSVIVADVLLLKLLHNLVRLTCDPNRLSLPMFSCRLPTPAMFSVFPLRLHLLPTLNPDDDLTLPRLLALPTRHLG